MAPTVPALTPAAVEQLLQRRHLAVKVVSLRPLKPDAGHGAGEKAAGYGQPVRVLAEDAAGHRRTFVLHTAAANAFGHDRRADRIEEVFLAHDTFQWIPHHVAALDVGFVTPEGLASAGAEGEPYLLTDWVEGRPYADDLRRIVQSGADGADLARCRGLATYLADLHHPRLDGPARYRRAVRDLLGHGEGIFGIVDGYPADTPAAPPARLEAIERQCLAWRWKLRGRESRLARIHGDFHPFNIVFAESGTLGLLDASRGCAGEPADDVAALAINYVFFAADAPARWPDFSRLWTTFWLTYLERSRDSALLEVAAPWLAWRALVVANPTFYPGLSPRARERILGFAEKALAAPRLELAWADEAF